MIARCGTRALDYLDNVGRLPEGSTLVLHDVSWGDYERLVDDLAKGSHRRVCYDRGRLEIKTPLPEHEISVRLIDALARAYAEERRLDVENYGSTTWKRESLGKVSNQTVATTSRTLAESSASATTSTWNRTRRPTSWSSSI